MRRALFSLSRGLFIVMMAAVLLLLLLFQNNIHYACQKDFLLSNIEMAIIIFAVLCMTFFGCYLRDHCNCRIRIPEISDRLYDNAAVRITLCLLIAEIYISYNIFCTNEWDPGGIWKTAVARFNGDLGWSEGIAHYFSMYPNNLLLLLLETACLKLNSTIGVFTEDYNMMSAIVVDCMTISCSCYLVYKVLTLHVNRKFAFGGFIISVVLFGLSPWMSICYSDSLGIIFPVLTYYLYTKPAKNTRLKWMEQFLATVVSCIGYFIKPQCIIILMAIVIVELFNCCKERKLTQLLKPVILIILACICLTVNSSVLQKQYESIGVKLDPEMRFGIEHFFMMGLNETDGGGFSQEDVDYSRSFETSKERTEGNIERSVERLRKMGFAGYLRQISRKLLTVYCDGTFAWGMEGGFYVQVVDNVNTCMTPFLKSIYYSDGSRHEVFKLTEQFVWITILILAFASGLIKQTEENRTELSILMLTIVGLTVFEMLFEVRARYLFLYTPIYCILATLGCENMYSIIQTHINRKPSVLKNINKCKARLNSTIKTE